MDIIVVFGWRWFVKSLEATFESVVWEFYANVLNAINNRVKVLGVQVLFGSSDINSYYSLIDVFQGEYESYLDIVDYTKVIETLAL